MWNILWRYNHANSRRFTLAASTRCNRRKGWCQAWDYKCWWLNQNIWMMRRLMLRTFGKFISSFRFPQLYKISFIVIVHNRSLFLCTDHYHWYNGIYHCSVFIENGFQNKKLFHLFFFNLLYIRYTLLFLFFLISFICLLYVFIVCKKLIKQNKRTLFKFFKLGKKYLYNKRKV